MDLIIEGWEPTPLERALMEGTFNEMAEREEEPQLPDDLMDVQPFEVAMEELREEISRWNS